MCEPVSARIDDKGGWLRLRHGAIFLGGAILYLLLVEGPLDFDWTPLLLGLVYLLAALAGGREGGFWATALVLCGWGFGVVLAREVELDAPEAALDLAGVGAGIVVAALLARRGFAIDLLGIGATALAGGVVYALQRNVDLVLEPGLYAFLLGLVGAFNVLLAVGPRRDGERPDL